MPRVVSLALAAGVACGCSVEATDDDLATSAAALGELGCAIVGGSPYSGSSTNGTTTSTLLGCAGYVSSTSPDNQYDNGASCPNQYIFEHTNLSSAVPYSVGIDWAGSARTSSNCGGSHLELGVYKFNGSTLLATTTHKYHGVWNSGASRCDFVLDSGYSAPTLSGVTGVRLAGRAWSLGPPWYIPLDVPAKVALWRGPC